MTAYFYTFPFIVARRIFLLLMKFSFYYLNVFITSDLLRRENINMINLFIYETLASLLKYQRGN